VRPRQQAGEASGGFRGERGGAGAGGEDTGGELAGARQDLDEREELLGLA
jgi:hypothetical protein